MSSGTHAARGAISGAERERVRLAEILSSPAAPWIALGVLVLGTGGVLMYETRGVTIWLDEWTWLLHRRGHALSTLVTPYNDHLSAIPVGIYKLLFATAGLRHSWPYRALLIGEHVAICAGVFVYARRRVGALLALVASALILLFGAGWEELLWSFQIAWNTSLLAGVAALLALDRRDRAGDIAACLLLIVSLASSGLGVPILIGAAVEVVLVRWRAPREWWVVAVPAVLYGLWALDYQHTSISGHAFVAAPRFVATGVASTFAGLAGLGGTTGLDGPGTLMTWGPVLLLGAIVLAGWRLARVRGLTPRLLSLATILVAFWVLTALTRYLFADPYSSRYLYVSGLFVVLLAIELAAGLALPRWLEALIAGVAAVAIVSSFGALRDAAHLMRGEAVITRADLGAAEIGRPVMPAGYVLRDIPGWPALVVPAADYFAAARDVGTPAANPQQIPTLPESAREAADRELISIHGLTLSPARPGVRFGGAPVVDRAVAGVAIERGGCVAFTRGAFTAAGAPAPYISITVPPSGISLQAVGAPTSVGVRRFGDSFQTLGNLGPGAATTLVIAADRSSQPWHVLLTPAGRALACGL